VGVSVAEIEAARRDRETVEETEIAGTRDLVAVSVTEADTVTACERDAVALMLAPPPEDGRGNCAHPAEAAKAKKKSFLIIFIPVLYLLYVISCY
jgi:hypothetical protein